MFNQYGDMPQNLAIYSEIGNVPENAKIYIKSGRHNGLVFVKPQYVIECLTEKFGISGFGWVANYEVVTQSNDQLIVVKCSLRVKIDDKFSEPIEGYGTAYAKVLNPETQKFVTSDDAYKAAKSDALRNASFSLGLGNTLFDNEREENQEEETKKEEVVKEEATPNAPEKTTDNKFTIEDALATEYESGKTIKSFIGSCKNTNDKVNKLKWLVQNRPQAKEASIYLIAIAEQNKK